MLQDHSDALGIRDVDVQGIVDRIGQLADRCVFDRAKPTLIPNPYYHNTWTRTSGNSTPKRPYLPRQEADNRSSPPKAT